MTKYRTDPLLGKPNFSGELPHGWRLCLRDEQDKQDEQDEHDGHDEQDSSQLRDAKPAHPAQRSQRIQRSEASATTREVGRSMLNLGMSGANPEVEHTL